MGKIDKIILLGNDAQNLVTLLEDMRNYIELHRDGEGATEDDLMHRLYLTVQAARAGIRFSCKV